MQKALDITHHGFEASESLDQHIAEKARKLEKFHEGIVGCHVSVHCESGKQNSHKSWTAKVVLTVPPRQELVGTKVVNHGAENRESVILAVDGAFDAVAKQLRKLAGKHG